MGKLEKIIAIIACLLIIIIIILICLSFKQKDNTDSQPEESNIDPESFEIKVEDNIEPLTDSDNFFMLQEIVQNYYNYINEEKYESLNNILDSNYKQKNSISSSNIKDKIEKTDETRFIANKIEYKEDSLDLTRFIISGSTFNKKYKYIHDTDFTITIDYDKEAFSVYPQNMKGSLNELSKDINVTDDNTISYLSIEGNDLIKKYYNYYFQMEKSNPEIAFKYLDKDYKKKRFDDSLDKFTEYCNNINFKELQIVKYGEEYLEDSNQTENNDESESDDENKEEGEDIYIQEYICQDNHNNYYTFDIVGPMDFTVKLDSYTILSKKFKNTYDSSDDSSKVKMNIDTFFHMINNKDFDAAYNVLSEDFRNKHYKKVDEFKDFVQNSLFEYNKFEFSNYEKQSNIHSYKIKLTDLTEKEKDKEKNLNILMKLKDNYDFEITFNNN